MNPNQTEPELPKFQDMPEPACLLKLSWEDVVAAYHTQYGKIPSREETIEMFRIAERRMPDSLMEDFWLSLEIWVRPENRD